MHPNLILILKWLNILQIVLAIIYLLINYPITDIIRCFIILFIEVIIHMLLIGVVIVFVYVICWWYMQVVAHFAQIRRVQWAVRQSPWKQMLLLIQVYIYYNHF
jgi:hypothetical protein